MTAKHTPAGEPLMADERSQQVPALTEAQAWKKYNDDIEAVRQLILSSPLTNHDPQARAEALSILPQIQANAYSMVIAPRQDYPRFFTPEYFENIVFSYNLPNPDFLYRTTFLNGRRSYRISGRSNSASWVNFQSANCFSGVGVPNPQVLGNWDLEQFRVEQDGSFEIAVSAEPQDGNWIRIDRDSSNNWVNVRQLVYGDEKVPDMHIEEVGGDDLPRTMYFDEAELARRISLAGETVKYIVMQMTHARMQNVVLPQTGGYNAFHAVAGTGKKKDTADGCNPIAVYNIAAYEIEPDEALILEADAPKSYRYWGVQLGDILNQTRDYIEHQSSLNDRDVVADADGKLRLVLSAADPGVPYWLDSIGTTFGRVVWRWYGVDGPVVPTIKRVKLAELREHLPASTPMVTPAERRQAVKARARMFAARYGY